MNTIYSSIFQSLFLKISAYLALNWWILPGLIMKLWIEVPSTLIYSFFFLYMLMSPCNPLSSVWISLFYKTGYLSYNLSFGVAAAGEKKKKRKEKKIWPKLTLLWIAWGCATCHLANVLLYLKFLSNLTATALYFHCFSPISIEPSCQSGWQLWVTVKNATNLPCTIPSFLSVFLSPSLHCWLLLLGYSCPASWSY